MMHELFVVVAAVLFAIWITDLFSRPAPRQMTPEEESEMHWGSNNVA